MAIERTELKRAASAYLRAGKNKTEAAKMLGMPRRTFGHRLEKAREQGLLPAEELDCVEDCHEVGRLSKQVQTLQKEVTRLEKERVTDEDIRQYLFGLSNAKPILPPWLQDSTSAMSGLSGVPQLLCSDWHFGEVVDPDQVFDKNEYNLEIAKRRVHIMVENSIDLLKNHLMRDPNYPGLVVLLGGDMLSGDIHDELTATNDRPTLPVLLELYGVLIQTLLRFADEFGQVMVFCVPGNHSRTTKKIQAKQKAYTNYDWLLGQLLEKHFERDDRINFNVANGSDLQYKIYGHRYRLTHGDQFRGGSGFIGPYAPITRGEIKKRSAAETYGMNYDTLVIGHFHQLMTLNRVIVNGSLIGYNEYAIQNNFPYEPPKQALWLTHPTHGITVSAPVFCTDTSAIDCSEDWVTWKNN